MEIFYKQMQQIKLQKITDLLLNATTVSCFIFFGCAQISAVHKIFICSICNLLIDETLLFYLTQLKTVIESVFQGGNEYIFWICFHMINHVEH